MADLGRSSGRKRPRANDSAPAPLTRSELEAMIRRLEEENEGLQSAAEELRVLEEELKTQQEELNTQQDEINAQLKQLAVQEDELVVKAREIEALLEKEKASFDRALRANESRFKAVFDQALVGIAELGPGGHIVRANDAMSELLGYSQAELIGKRFFSFTHPDEVQIELGHFSQVAEGDVPSYTLEKRLVRRDRSLLWIDSALSAIPGAAGEADRFVLIVRDISKRKKAEAERERLLAAEQDARNVAETAVRVRDEFLSIAAHELKTPVTSLVGYAQTLVRQYKKTGGVDVEKILQSMGVIERQSLRLNRLIEQLLNLSRLEAGKLTLSMEEVNLTRTIQNLIASIKHSRPERTIDLRSGEEIRIRADALRLEQVFTNLIDNALKFSPVDSPVEVEVERSGQGWVRVAVRDYGFGIPEEKRGRLFEKFYQAHMERYYGGMGIGLFISQQIVQMHGGTLSLEQPEGKGSRFVVRVPSTKDDAWGDG